VVVDQLVDRTSGREETFYDHFHDGPCHVSLADPYDAGVRGCVLGSAQALELTVHDGGAVVVVNGPRFSTRAESSWFRAMGADLVNMTQHPEAALAREANLRYAGSRW
jgi:5'-methylthioadenosine phosphorylase